MGGCQKVTHIVRLSHSTVFKIGRFLVLQINCTYTRDVHLSYWIFIFINFGERYQLLELINLFLPIIVQITPPTVFKLGNFVLQIKWSHFKDIHIT